MFMESQEFKRISPRILFKRAYLRLFQPVRSCDTVIIIINIYSVSIIWVQGVKSHFILLSFVSLKWSLLSSQRNQNKQPWPSATPALSTAQWLQKGSISSFWWRSLLRWQCVGEVNPTIRVAE